MNGVCEDGVDSFYCNYTDTDFTGDTCSISIDDCASNPCENYGQCVDSINAYFCMCLPGFTGENCELNMDDCKPNPRVTTEVAVWMQ